MRNILFASASILAFAGAASAQDAVATGIIFGGDASLGFNDATAGSANGDPEDTGFFYEANLDVTFRTILDNGLVAESTFTIPIADTNLGNDNLGIDNDFVLGLSIDGVGSLQLGDVPFGAEEFTFATMQSADFSEQDSETVLRSTSTLAGFTVAASALILDSEGDEPGDGRGGDDYIDQISVGANGNIGRFFLSLGYQNESDILAGGEFGPDDYTGQEGIFDSDNGDFNPREQFGIAIGTTLYGATVAVGYGANYGRDGIDADGDGDIDIDDELFEPDSESYGIQVSYPFGPVTGTVEYVIEPDYDDDSFNIAVAYDVGNIILQAEYGQEIGEDEYDIKVGYAFSETTNIQAGYDDDDGGFVAVRQGFGAGAFVEASYAEADDSGFGNDLYVDDVREGATIRVGLEF